MKRSKWLIVYIIYYYLILLGNIMFDGFCGHAAQKNLGAENNDDFNEKI